MSAGLAGGATMSLAPWVRAGSPASAVTADGLAGMPLEQLLADYRRRLFDDYLPFWERGSYDRELGGFMCELNDDGSVASDEKNMWYQGRAVWVYSFLYNEFGHDNRWLEMAARTRDFMIRHMDAGKGRWREKVHRDGRMIEGVGPNVYGSLFAATGLAEYYLAAGHDEDLQLAKASAWAAVKAYNDPNYCDTHTTLHTGLSLPPQGLRSQGHSMVLVNTLTRLLERRADSRLEELVTQHVDAILHKFWNPDYGIQNEYLDHEYRRVPAAAQHMLTGHSLEALWMVLHDALRRKDRETFDLCQRRMRRLIEMNWDYVFDGLCGNNFLVFGDQRRPPGPELDTKTMWPHCEAMIGCLSILEHTGEPWARQWYERIRAYTLRTMPVPHHGVWRQAVDRRGNDRQRVGVSTKRKDNFHQARYLMLDTLCLQRMIARGGR